ncbi:SGNH/GDSL hydrolase family protein [Mucilaginibacter sp.]|jgi:sialidase-1|uniref:SGNH/GDSL hydrolase family protein n=1 Tax=Mucilaginibacter sp. TaxID=1882438 RepID=UPI0035642278
MLKICLLFILFIFAPFLLAAQSANHTQQGQWRGYKQVFIDVGKHKGYYVQPQKPLPGNPWVWRASFPEWHTEIDSILLKRGFFIAYINVDDQYGSPYAMGIWDAFYARLVNSLHLAARPALEAVSRGTLYAMTWAKRNPDKVSCIYNETPVYDFKSWPGGKGKGPGDSTAWRQLKAVYHFTEEQAIAYNDNPVDHLEGLASFKVPVLNVIGIHDQLAPREENTDLFVQRYTNLGGPTLVYPVTEGPQELQGHHFPIKHSGTYADFIFTSSYPVKSVLSYNRYFTLRNSLNHFYEAAIGAKKANVAFMGGSITYNPGWREKVCAYLRERFPETQFRFIAAGIPSLGSLPHAFRLKKDVLDSGKVDLLVLEAAVNDRVNRTDSLTQVRSLEGIIRHTRHSNPLTDILLLEFADPYKNNDYNKGVTPVEIINHELVAAHYGLPSINLSREVYDKLKNREFSWEDDFKDLHPSAFGQELYFQTIKSLLETSFEEWVSLGTSRTKASAPWRIMNASSFNNGNYYSIKNARYDSGWQMNENWVPNDQAGTRDGFVNIPVLGAVTPGASLKLPFHGTAIGVVVLSGPDAGIISYSIDNKPFTTVDLYTEWSGGLHLPWFVLLDGNLERGKHVLTLKVNEAKNINSRGTSCRIVNFFKND